MTANADFKQGGKNGPVWARMGEMGWSDKNKVVGIVVALLFYEWVTVSSV